MYGKGHVTVFAGILTDKKIRGPLGNIYLM